MTRVLRKLRLKVMKVTAPTRKNSSRWMTRKLRLQKEEMTRVLKLPVGVLKDASILAIRVGRDDVKVLAADQKMLTKPRTKIEARHYLLLTQGVAGDVQTWTNEVKFVLLTQGLAGELLQLGKRMLLTRLSRCC